MEMRQHPGIQRANVHAGILKEAGLPDGVINLVFVDGPTIGKLYSTIRIFAGIHFTGSTGVFNKMWETIGRIWPCTVLIPVSLVKRVVRIW